MTEEHMNPTTTKQVQDKKDEFDPKVAAAHIARFGGTKSGAIRGLTAEGKTRGEISKILNIRYQHVRNVLITPGQEPDQEVADRNRPRKVGFFFRSEDQSGPDGAQARL